MPSSSNKRKQHVKSKAHTSRHFSTNISNTPSPTHATAASDPENTTDLNSTTNITTITTTTTTITTTADEDGVESMTTNNDIDPKNCARGKDRVSPTQRVKREKREKTSSFPQYVPLTALQSTRMEEHSTGTASRSIKTTAKHRNGSTQHHVNRYYSQLCGPAPGDYVINAQIMSEVRL
jgi:hypothetical protein